MPIVTTARSSAGRSIETSSRGVGGEPEEEEEHGREQVAQRA